MNINKNQNANRKKRRFLKILLLLILVPVLIAAGYVIYVFASWHRIGDQQLEIKGKASETLSAGETYRLLSWNIGFGAYESDYGFFMDGGTQSWAWSKERLLSNLSEISALVARQETDFCLVQEVDFDSTRSYHVDEREYLLDALSDGEYTYVFAQNYDSPFLFYPFRQPHGASRSGLMTFSRGMISSAQRIELPIENSLMKLLDLDRCYSKSYISADDGKSLVLYNLHLSAYTSDGTIANEQLKMLISDMQTEYEAGNYCIAGGDFNKDLLGDSEKWFGKADREYTWAQPLPEGTFDGTDIAPAVPLDRENPVPTCRNADSAYHEGQYVLTIDGFLISPNVKVSACSVIDTEFAFSDHNPVFAEFVLETEN